MSKLCRKFAKKSKKPAATPLPAIDIEFHIALCEDGSVAIAYSGYDERTYATGDAIVAAIAHAYDLDVDQIFQGEARTA